MPSEDENTGFPPPLDLKVAAELVGKIMLVGLTHLDSSESFLSQEQFWGVVARADGNGILLKLEGKRAGEEVSLPPDLRSVRPANPGEYELRSTGEIVINPDYTATWTVTHPPKEQ